MYADTLIGPSPEFGPIVRPLVRLVYMGQDVLSTKTRENRTTGRPQSISKSLFLSFGDLFPRIPPQGDVDGVLCLRGAETSYPETETDERPD